jgi:hypothetical protein
MDDIENDSTNPNKSPMQAAQKPNGQDSKQRSNRLKVSHMLQS